MSSCSTGNEFFKWSVLLSYTVIWFLSQWRSVMVVLISQYGSLLLRRECCSFSNGEFVKSGLAELEQWCIGATGEVTMNLCLPDCFENFWSVLIFKNMQYAGSAWDELSHIRQAVGFLVRFVNLVFLNFIVLYPLITDLICTYWFLILQVIHQKPKKTLNEITKELCPVGVLTPYFATWPYL